MIKWINWVIGHMLVFAGVWSLFTATWANNAIYITEPFFPHAMGAIIGSGITAIALSVDKGGKG